MKTKVIIKNLYDNKDYIISNDNGLIEHKLGSQTENDSSSPSYCICAGYGTIRFYDSNNNIEKFLKKGYFNDNKKVEIYLGNEQIGIYEIKKFSQSGLIVTMELQDILIRTQNIFVPFYYYNGRGDNILQYIIKYLKNNGYTTTELENYITSIGNINNKVLKGDYLWNQLNKICELLQINIFTNQKDGSITYVKPKNQYIKIANENYYSKPEINPFENNEVKNISQKAYFIKDKGKETVELSTTRDDFKAYAENYDIKAKVFTTKGQSWIGQYIYSNSNINNNGISVMPVASSETKYKLSVGSAGYIYYKIINFMYLLINLPNDNYYQGIVNNVSATLKYSLYSDAYAGKAGSETISLQPTNLPIEILTNEELFNKNKDKLIEFVYTSTDIYSGIYWYLNNGKNIDMYVLLPINSVETSGVDEINYKSEERIYTDYIIKLSDLPSFDINEVEVKINNNENIVELQSNELLDRVTAQKNVINDYNKWNKGLKSIELTLFKNNYYSLDNKLIYSLGSGNTIEVGDKIVPFIKSKGIEKQLIETDDNKYHYYIVNKREIIYNGNVKINITAREDGIVS